MNLIHPIWLLGVSFEYPKCVAIENPCDIRLKNRTGSETHTLSILHV